MTATVNRTTPTTIGSWTRLIALSRFKIYLFEHLPDGESSQSDVARHLELSSRVLQQRLHKEGTNFKNLLDKTRHKLTLKSMMEPGLFLADVTYLLGFSDQS